MLSPDSPDSVFLDEGDSGGGCPGVLRPCAIQLAEPVRWAPHSRASRHPRCLSLDEEAVAEASSSMECSGRPTRPSGQGKNVPSDLELAKEALQKLPELPPREVLRLSREQRMARFRFSRSISSVDSFPHAMSPSGRPSMAQYRRQILNGKLRGLRSYR